MGKDDNESKLDFDMDPEFTENFNKNIEKAFADNDSKEPEKTEDVEDGYAVPDMGTESNIQDDIGEGVDETLVDINESLAKQISEELKSMDNGKARKKKRLTKLQGGLLLSLAGILCIVLFLGFTRPGKDLLLKMGINVGGKLWDSMTQDFEDTPVMAADTDTIEQADIESTAPEIDPSTIVWPDHPGEGRQEEGVYNILLLGEEAIGNGDARGRTDEIVIATLNTNQKTVKLTSLMRDTLVQIPGYLDNKLNSAYEKGGLDLLYQTISLNFDIHLDGAVLVNFENFEKIIDQLGGLEITLNKVEADYLNRTNYISKPQNRDVVEGTQLMNGNQVLGYARVRKVSTITGNNNDYGRTDRHRAVLNAIFEKYKTTSKVELAKMMFSLLPMLKTDIDSKAFEMLLNAYVDMGVTKVDQLRIPVDGSFTDNVKVRGMDALIPDIEKNVSALHSFIFGDPS